MGNSRGEIKTNRKAFYSTFTFSNLLNNGLTNTKPFTLNSHEIVGVDDYVFKPDVHNKFDKIEHEPKGQHQNEGLNKNMFLIIKIYLTVHIFVVIMGNFLPNLLGREGVYNKCAIENL